jgi:hypothetical protein
MKKDDSEKKLRAYRAYNKYELTGDILVFAFTAKQAKRLAYPYALWSLGIINEYLELEIRWIRDGVSDIFCLGNQELLQYNTPHVIDDPTGCNDCLTYGMGLDENLMCCGCGKNPGEELREVYRKGEELL